MIDERAKKKMSVSTSTLDLAIPFLARSGVSAWTAPDPGQQLDMDVNTLFPTFKCKAWPTVGGKKKTQYTKAFNWRFQKAS
jgi:hypothetical protein